MTAMIDLRRIIEDVLVPGIQEIRLKVSAMDTKIDHQDAQLKARMDQLDAKIDNQNSQFQARIESQGNTINSFRGEILAEIRRLDQKIDSFGERFDFLGKQLQLNREDFKLAISIHERLAAVEARIAAH